MSSIGSIGSSYSTSMMQGTRQRPDTAKMAEEMFAQLDTSGQGFIQKADLQAAFDKTSSASSSTSGISSASSTVDELFSSLDTDSNGKVSKQEFTDRLATLQSELDQQYQDSRMQTAIEASRSEGMGGRPPPPPPGEGPSMTKDELSTAISETSTSDSQSTMMSEILQNFEQADTNSDGEVSFQEARAFQELNSSSSSTSSTASASGSSSADAASSNSSTEAKVMMQIMKLMQAYGIGNEQSQASSLMSSQPVSV